MFHLAIRIIAALLTLIPVADVPADGCPGTSVPVNGPALITGVASDPTARCSAEADETSDSDEDETEVDNDI